MDNMTLPRAAGILLRNFPRVDIAARLGSPDGRFGVKDLEAVSSETYEGTALHEAAEYVLQQPYAFLKLDTASGQAPDSFVTVQDLAVAANRSTDDGVNVEEAAGILKQNFPALDTAAGLGEPDGLVGREDLQAAVFNPRSTPELRSAALLLLGNGPVFQEFDLGAGIGPADGLIGYADADQVERQRAFQRALGL